MVFGGPDSSEKKKRIVNVVLDDLLWKLHVDKGEECDKLWMNKWSWILKEYNDMHYNLLAISKRSKFLAGVYKQIREEDLRTIKPIPDSVNKEYGWLAKRNDFVLEKFGPDYVKGASMPSEFILFKQKSKFR